jgi:hypothetical protein
MDSGPCGPVEDAVIPEPTSTKTAVEPPTELKNFHVGTRLVRLSCSSGRWNVSVESAALDRWYTSEADAWEAGVREVDRLERMAGS